MFHSVSKIIMLVCKEFNIQTHMVLTGRGSKSVSDIRHIAFYLSRELTDKSTVQIGKVFKRDHSTVVTGSVHGKELAKDYPVIVERIRKAYKDE
jgi:chromosomal replication initiation ATPase DnaA